MTKFNRAYRNKILGLLRENPNLQRACKKAGIARSTLYRWMEDDIAFRDDIRNAQEIGQDTMNDYVEAKLMESIQNNSQRSIEFYLRHNNPKYASTRTEAEYLSRRGINRIMTMPYGTDQVYFSDEIQMYDKAIKLARIREMINNVKSEMRDPNTPINPENFDPDFAREFYQAFPEAKQIYEKQMEEYYKQKGGVR